MQRILISYRLPTLLHHELRHLILPRQKSLPRLLKQLSSLAPRRPRPGGEGILGRGHGFVHVVLARNGHIPERLLVGRVDSVADLRARTLLSVDNVAESGEVDGGSSHDEG